MTKVSFLLAAAGLIAAPALGQVMSASDYVAIAGASDLYERQSAQMILESTQDPKIRSFARMMLQDHGKSTVAVEAAAAKSRVPAPAPMLMPLQAELLAELRAETGPARDAAYVAQQKAAHNQALAVQKAYAAGGAAPALRAAAARIVPVVQHHVAMLKTM